MKGAQRNIQSVNDGLEITFTSMTEIRKAVQFPHVYGKQPDFCYFSPDIVGCPNVTLVLIGIFFMSENRSF